MSSWRSAPISSNRSGEGALGDDDALAESLNRRATSDEEEDEEDRERSRSDASIRSIMRPSTGRLDRRPSTGKSVRFHGRDDISDREQLERLELIRKLENPHTDIVESSDEDSADIPLGSEPPLYPTTAPPPYSTDKDGARINSPDPKPPENTGKRGSLHEAVLNKVTQPFVNMMKAISTDDESDEDMDRGDFTRDEIWVLDLLNNHRSDSIMVKPQLQPFTVDFIPAIGDIDAFIKIPRPDEVEDNAGLTQLDEPAAKQSDPTILDMQMRSAAKEVTTQEDAPVKRLRRADKNKGEIDNWIANIKELHRTRPAPSVNIKGPMPDVEKLMQEWPQDFEKKLVGLKLPTADLDCSLEEMVDICCNLVDIPVGASRIHSLYQFFSLYSQFKNSQHFKNLDHNRAQNSGQKETTERLEL